jgi:hypothetical protein
MFVEVKPSPRTLFVGISVTDYCIRISKEMRQKLKTNKIGIKRDEDKLEIGIYEGGDHVMKEDGRICISKKTLKMPSGRYSFKRIDGDKLFVCAMRV